MVFEHCNGLGDALKQWKDYAGEASNDPNEKFLMDYILTRGWVDKAEG